MCQDCKPVRTYTTLINGTAVPVTVFTPAGAAADPVNFVPVKRKVKTGEWGECDGDTHLFEGDYRKVAAPATPTKFNARSGGQPK
jgi:hypothetical protein